MWVQYRVRVWWESSIGWETSIGSESSIGCGLLYCATCGLTKKKPYLFSADYFECRNIRNMQFAITIKGKNVQAAEAERFTRYITIVMLKKTSAHKLVSVPACSTATVIWANQGFAGGWHWSSALVCAHCQVLSLLADDDEAVWVACSSIILLRKRTSACQCSTIFSSSSILRESRPSASSSEVLSAASVCDALSLCCKRVTWAASAMAAHS